MKKIIIDTLGGDNGPSVFIKGAYLASRDFHDYFFIFIGPKDELQKELDLYPDFHNYEIIDCNEIYPNEESPLNIARGRDETSLATGLNLLKEDDNVAFISSGSTGAFLVGSIFKVGLFDGLKFPCLASPMINIHEKWFTLLDCGANLDVNAKTLVKFAKMGTALMKSSFGEIYNPRVGLLNVGKEETKGNALAKEAYPLLKETNLNFVGNIEGHEIYLDKADVIVCDGFVGNVFLKGAEALSMVIESIFRQKGNNDPKINEIADYVHKNFNYNDEGAAIFLGPKKICLKCHGHASEKTVYSAIKFASNLDKGNFISHMKEELEK